MKLSVFRSEELPEAAAHVFASAIRDTIAERGRCSFALSRPPRDVLSRLAQLDLEWRNVDIFQVDERVAPDGDPERNLTLIDRDVPRAATLHPMPVTDPDLEDAARRYEDELLTVCGSPPVLDVVHLGLGPDGHTASLLPDDPVLEVRDRSVAVTAEAAGYRRLTLTYQPLDAARVVIFVVSGGPKAAALARLVQKDPSIPAGRLRAVDIRILADHEAASNI